MRTIALTVAALALLGLTCSIGQAQLGVGAKIPLAAFAQLWLSPSFAVEVGLPLGTIGVALAVNTTAKIYLGALNLGGLSLEPYAGAGLSVIMAGALATGFHALGGLEYTVPDTAFSLFGEIGLSYVEVLGFGAMGLGGAVGARLDF